MTWHVLVDVRTTDLLPAGLRDAVEEHPLVAGASVHAPVPPASGWRRAFAAFGASRSPSVLLALEVDDRDEAERVAAAAVEEALARTGVEGVVRVAGAFRR